MLLFRVDGNGMVGAGHMMRCLSLADAGRTLGQPSLFVTAGRESGDMISSRGYENYVLDASYIELDVELPQMERLLKKEQPDILFVDSYHVTANYFRGLSAVCQKIRCKLVYLDDVMAFAYECDFLINYNIYGLDWEECYRRLYEKEGRKLPQFLLGVSYAPLRKEFQNRPVRIVKDDAGEILVSTGGADPEHLGYQMAVSIVKYCEALKQYRFHFVIGSMNDDREKIERIADQTPFITTHYNVRNMAELMWQCDLAISAAGSTLYELCATQTPTVTYAFADNQVPGAKAFEHYGGLRYAGDFRELGESLVKRLLSEAVNLAHDGNARRTIAVRQRELVDGQGASRILERLGHE